MGELYSRYHGRILRLATQATSDGAWKAKLREILAEFEYGLDHCAFRDAGAREKALRVRLYRD